MRFSEALIQMIIQEAPHLSLIPQNCYDWYIGTSMLKNSQRLVSVGI